MKDLYINDQGKYCFVNDGIEISNPTMSDCGRFPINLEKYGFEEWHTGGGCTGHAQIFNLNGQVVIMLLTDGNLHHVSIEDKEISGGIFDEDMENCLKELFYSRV